MPAKPPPAPSTPLFRVTERRLEAFSELLVEGELDMSCAAEMRTALARAAHGSEQLVVNLDGCRFIDSSGIAALLEARQDMAAEGRRLAVYGATDQVLRVLKITGLTGGLLVFESADEAFAHVAGS